MAFSDKIISKQFVKTIKKMSKKQKNGTKKPIYVKRRKNTKKRKKLNQKKP